MKRRYKVEQKIDTKKKVIRAILWAVVILALLGTMHILVTYFDLFTFLQ
jgi:hypothetical protein